MSCSFMSSSLYASNFYQPCNSFHHGDNVWCSLINHSQSKKHKKKLLLWTFGSTGKDLKYVKRERGGDSLWETERWEVKSTCARVCYLFPLWSRSLLSAFACGQVCSCHDSPPPRNRETDRRGVPVKWGAVMSPPVSAVTALFRLM